MHTLTKLRKGDYDMFEKGVLDLAALTESSEFDPKAKNGDPDNHVDDPNVSIPGGLKEQPTKDAIVMTTKEYDDARKKLQQSFKECGAMMTMLSSVKVVNENGEQQTGGNLTMNELYKEYLMGYAESGITEPPVTFEEFVNRINGDTSDEPVNESADNNDSENELLKEAYSEYLMQFAESGIDESPCSFTEFVEAANNASSITEATRLAKEIHKKNKANEESTKKIRELKQLQEDYPENSPRYKMIQKKIDALLKNDSTMPIPRTSDRAITKWFDSIGNASKQNSKDGSSAKSNQRDYYKTGKAKEKESLAEFRKKLKSIGESVSGKEFLEMYIRSMTDDEE